MKSDLKTKPRQRSLAGFLFINVMAGQPIPVLFDIPLMFPWLTETYGLGGWNGADHAGDLCTCTTFHSPSILTITRLSL
jgi:hypothetical protein